MKRSIGIAVVVVVVAVAAWTAFQVKAGPSDESLARFMPQNAVVFLEAEDFSSLLNEWNRSPEKQQWLGSDNYAVFSRSRLFGRLEQVQGEFEQAAGVPPDFDLLVQVAGKRSALALYDIGNLELLYISQVTSPNATKSQLWEERSKFEPRSVAGKQFFVRTDPKTNRTVAFASVGDYFVVGTREDLVAGAVMAISGQKIATLAEEPWYSAALKEAGTPGELRTVVHLAEVTTTPQFRTYWAPQNITALRQYESSVSDLHRTASEYRDNRVLLAKAGLDLSTPDEENTRIAGELAAAVPATSGFSQVSVVTSTDKLAETIESKLLAPRLGPGRASRFAPTVPDTQARAGSESDLETRIDEPPVKADRATDVQFRELLKSHTPRAVLEVSRSRQSSDGVFVGTLCTMVIAADEDWNLPGVQSSVQSLLAPTITASQLGVQWVDNGSGKTAYSSLDGLLQLSAAAHGKYLFLSNDPEMLQQMLGAGVSKAQSPLVYAASFNHERERENFFRLTTLLDRGNGESDSEPAFFSRNIASLSKIWSAVRSQEVTIRRRGNIETQEVRYEWAR